MIICNICKKNEVDHDGDKCDKCKDLIITDLAEDRQGQQTTYLPKKQFERLLELIEKVENGNKKAETTLGTIMKRIKTAVIHPFTGEKIMNPVPVKISPREKTIDRIQRILDHNMKVHAQEIEPDIDDWSVPDLDSDEFEQTLLQLVPKIETMEDDDLEPLDAEPAIEPDPQKSGEEPSEEQDPASSAE